MNLVYRSAAVPSKGCSRRKISVDIETWAKADEGNVERMVEISVKSIKKKM